MPIFFIVGGYANAVSLESAQRGGVGHTGWLAKRLYRLVTPLLALLLGWAVLAMMLCFAGVDGDITRLAPRGALGPTWFLAIYIMVVLIAPLTYAIWRRWGFASFWAFAAMGALVDCFPVFAAGAEWAGGRFASTKRGKTGRRRRADLPRHRVLGAIWIRQRSATGARYWCIRDGYRWLGSQRSIARIFTSQMTNRIGDTEAAACRSSPSAIFVC